MDNPKILSTQHKIYIIQKRNIIIYTNQQHIIIKLPVTNK